MDNSIAKLEKALYENMANSDEWFAVAKRLEAAALTLQKHHPISKDNNPDFFGRAQEFMLWGFCLENLFKGLYAQKKQTAGNTILKNKPDSVKLKKVLQTHDLNKLANEICLVINTQEKLALIFFSKAIVFFGRYPLPIASKNMAVYWDEGFEDNLKNILARLKTEANID